MPGSFGDLTTKPKIINSAGTVQNAQQLGPNGSTNNSTTTVPISNKKPEVGDQVTLNNGAKVDFDENGNKILTNKDGTYSVTTPKGTDGTSSVSYYSATKELKKLENLDDKGAVKSSETYETDANGNKITRSFNADNKLTTKKVQSADGTSKVYSGMDKDAQGRPAQIDSYDAKGKITGTTEHKYDMTGGKRFPGAMYNRAAEFSYDKKGNKVPTREAMIFKISPSNNPTLTSMQGEYKKDGSMITAENHKTKKDVIETTYIPNEKPKVIDASGSKELGHYVDQKKRIAVDSSTVIDGQNVNTYTTEHNGQVPSKYEPIVNFGARMIAEEQPQE
jgi:hypothetical protein